MATIHHATIKKAAKHGLEIREEATGFTVLRDGVEIVSANDPKDALQLALIELGVEKAPGAPRAKVKKTTSPRKSAKRRKLVGGDEESDEEGDEEDSGKSIVKEKYKAKYRPHKMTNGDALAKKIRETFMTKKDEDTGKPRLDFAAFVKFAKVNECWVEGYMSLKNKHGERNNGMIRMNVVNRLRAKMRKKEEIIWP